MKYLIGHLLLLLVTDRADGGQKVLPEMTDYQPKARVEVRVEDVTQVHVRGVEGLSVMP